MTGHLEAVLRLERGYEDGVYVVRSDYGNDVSVRVGGSQDFDDLGQVCNGRAGHYSGPGIWIDQLFQLKAEDEYGASETYDNYIESENDACPEMNLKVHTPEQELLRVLNELAQ